MSKNPNPVTNGVKCAVTIDPEGVDSYINRNVALMPPEMFIIEAVRNSLQAGATVIAWDFVYVDDVRKLTITDNGHGIKHEFLTKVAKQLGTVSGKSKALDGSKGIGIKLAAWKASPRGTIFQTRNDSGRVWQFQIGTDDEGRHYSTEPVDVTDTLAEGAPKSATWTRLIFLGTSDEHDTVANPYADVGRMGVVNEISRRFFALPRGVNITVDEALMADQRGTSAIRARVYPVATVMQQAAAEKTSVKISDSLTLHVYRVPFFATSRESSNGNPRLHYGAAFLPPIIGVAFNDGQSSEFYWRRTHSDCREVLAFLGLRDVWQEVLIVAEVSNTDTVQFLPNEHRTGLLRNGSEVTLRTFAIEAVQNRPEWLRELLAAREQANASRYDDEARAEMDAVFRELGLLDPGVKKDGNGDLRGDDPIDVEVDFIPDHDNSSRKQRGNGKTKVLNPGDRWNAKAVMAAAKNIEVRVIFGDYFAPGEPTRTEAGVDKFPARAREEFRNNTSKVPCVDIDGEFLPIRAAVNMLRDAFANTPQALEKITADFKAYLEARLKLHIGIGFACRRKQQAAYQWTEDTAVQSLTDPASSNFAVACYPAVKEARDYMIRKLKQQCTQEAA